MAMKRHTLTAGTIHEGDWLQADLAPGYTLAILDGPYGIGKAAWDRMGVEGLAEWYAPHLARVSSLLAPSASLYVWNTAPGLKRLDPVIRALGWTWRIDITWDKGKTLSAAKAGEDVAWTDRTEVCGWYSRGPVIVGTRPEETGNVWKMAEDTYRGERLWSDDVKVDNRGWNWRQPLHPCQKPLLFAERMIRASTRPGERVLIPFGGTNREAVVMEWMARATPDEARKYDACELNADGVDYIGPVLAQIRGEDPRQRAAGQVPMFGRAS